MQYPFVGRVAESQQGSKEISSGGLRQFAASYLNRVRKRFELAKHEGNGAWSKNHLGDKSLAFDSGFEMTWLDRGEVLGGRQRRPWDSGRRDRRRAGPVLVRAAQ